MTRRVVFVAPFGLGQKSTVWARTLPLARVLATHGWAPTILIPPWDTASDASRAWEDQGVHVVHVALDGGLPATTFRLLREANGLEPDIVHVVKPRAYAGLVQWWQWQWRRLAPSKQRLVLDVDDWEQAWAPVNRYAWPMERFLAWQEEWGIRHADGISAASRWLVKRVRQARPSTPILYLPNGIDPPAADALRWSPGRGADVLYFSRFVEVSPAWLALFWQTMRNHRPDVRLLVAGAPVRPGLDSAFRDAIHAISTEAAASVEWLGYVDRRQLAARYPRVGCAIFPAEETFLQQAKCSVRLATTLLSGVPVVASAVGEQTSYGAAGAARLVAAGAPPQHFAEAVLELLAAPAQQATFADNAQRRLLEQFSWSLLGERLHTFYLQILAGAGASR